MKSIFRTSILLLGLLLGIAGSASAANSDGWEIRPLPAGGYEVTWTSPEPLPVTSARPGILLDGVPAGPASISPDGREVSATVATNDPPSRDRLTVALSGRSLDHPQAELPPVAVAPWIAPAAALPDLGFDPGRRGPHAIRTDDYTKAGWKYPGLPRKLEMKGHVVAPSDPAVAATGPLVLFLHGRHSTCYRPRSREYVDAGWPCRKGMKPIPSDLGYDYLQRILASQGFVTVSIAANGINGQDDELADGGANARAALVRRHLDLWAGWVAANTRQADLTRVVLIGHSRGGEGVNRAAEQIPLGAPYRIAGQVLLAPTNFARQSAAYIPTVTALPYCDGDVSDLEGQAYTDNSIGLAPGDSSLKSSVVMFGANHNYFNTEWTPGLAKAPAGDDSDAPPASLCGRRGKTRLTAGQQRRVADSYVAGAVQLMTGIDDRNAALFDGSPVRVGPVRKAPVISQSVGGGKLTLVAGREAVPAAGSPPGIFTCRGYAGEMRRDCARYADSELTPHWPSGSPAGIPSRPALAMNWSRPGTAARLVLPGVPDLTGMATLDLRTVVVPSSRTARFGLTIIDADGRQLELTPPAGIRADAMPSGRDRPGRWLARSLPVSIPDPAPGGFDLTRVSAMVIEGMAKPACGKNCPGASRIRLLDVSARPAGAIPAPPAARLPQVRLRPVRQPAGGPGMRTAEVPFTVSGNVTGPGAGFQVVVSGQTGIDPMKPVTVRLAPGQTAGTVAVPYRGNRAFDKTRTIVVEAYPLRGAIPTTSYATVRLVDGRRKPDLTVRAVNPAVRAGQPVRWRISTSRPVAWPATVDAQFAAAAGLPQLRLGELRPGWVAKRTIGTDGKPAGTPLTRTNAWINFGERPTRRPRLIEVPTRPFRGGPVRGIRLRLNVAGFGRVQTPVVRINPR